MLITLHVTTSYLCHTKIWFLQSKKKNVHVAVVSYLKKIVLSSDSLCVAPYVNFA